MLVKRVITAAILIPLVILLIFISNWVTFMSISFAVAFFAAWEWTGLLEVSKRDRLVLLGVFILMSLGALMIPGFIIILLGGGGWWLFAFCMLFLYEAKKKDWMQSLPFRVLAGILTLLPFCFALNILFALGEDYTEYGRYLILYLLALVWVADSAAYFIGKRFGKRKLAKKISPGKTVEGAVGALFCCLLYSALVGYYFIDYLPFSYLELIILSMIAAAFSIIGDLSKSIFKRIADVKDSGHILPGHGGLLDRIDGLTAAFPMFLFTIVFLGIVA